MGRGVVHRKVQQNKRRESVPDADHMMAATHFDGPPPKDPPVFEPTVTLTQSQLASMLARIAALESVTVADVSIQTSDTDTLHS